MPYTAAQLEMYNTKPATIVQYNTIEFYNSYVGWLRFVASGPGGPYESRYFLTPDGEEHEFKPVAAYVPDTSQQDTTTNELCTIRLGRVSSNAIKYLTDLIAATKRPQDRIIECRLSIYQGDGSSPVYSRKAYVGESGFVIGESDVNIMLEIENPLKIQFPYYYDPEIFPGLKDG